MKVQLVAFAALAVLCTATAYQTFEGYHVLKTKPLAKDDMRKLAPLQSDPTFNFWVLPSIGRPVEIMVPPANVSGLMSRLHRHGLEPTVMIEDVGVIVARERAEIDAARKLEAKTGKAPSFDRFLDLDEINAYLDQVVADYSSIASILEIGTTFEGRPMRVLKLSNGPGKSGMFIESVIHAREWIGPPTVLYFINELTENLSANQAMLDRNDFYFMPVANPDGYAFSWSDDRFWRKTRRPNPGSNCIGTDPNRNFDWNWGGGGIPSACEQTFPGSGPLSEIECKSYADFLTANPTINQVISVHSYGQMLLYSWGDTLDLPPNEPELNRISTEAMDALAAVRGTQYEVGPISHVLYYAYGGTIDWVLGALGKQAYAFELPGGGSGGFNPPASAIGPVVEETWEAYKVFAANIPPP